MTETLNILVTGATGFIGTKLVNELIKSHSVTILCRNLEKAKGLFSDTVRYIVGDITEPDTIMNCCDNIDIVYHLAAIMGHDLPGKIAFEKFRWANVIGTKNIVFEATKFGIKRFVVISSTAAMGLISDPVANENTPCAPWSPYQVSKRESELFILNQIGNKQFPAVIIRPSMIYGSGFKGDFLTIAKIVKTGIFPKIGLGENLSPALHIDDLIPPLVEAGISQKLKHNIYIVSSEESYPLSRVVNAISGAMGKRVWQIYCPKFVALLGTSILEQIFLLFGKKPPITRRNIESTITNRRFDISRAKEDLNFKQSISIENGLAQTVEYFKRADLL